jgi:hypothetical protein
MPKAEEGKGKRKKKVWPEEFGPNYRSKRERR